MTRFNYLLLHEAHKAKGVVVVIDVLRAFTTAAHAFTAGATRIFPVADVAEALLLRKTMPGSLIMGEVDGVKPEGFDFGNSPDQFREGELSGITLIQRTSLGTQGIVRAKKAERLFAASFVVAKATAVHIQMIDPLEVSFIVTGEFKHRDGDEDRACAEYIQALVQRKRPDVESYTRRVSQSTTGAAFLSDENRPVLGVDLGLGVQADRFSFSMPINRQGDLLVMTCNPL